jgi:hypothetical protein
MAEEQPRTARAKTRTRADKPVRVGSSSSGSMWMVLLTGSAMVLVAVLSSVLGWKVSLFAVALAVALMLFAFKGRDWMAHRFTSGLMQLPFPGVETARANTIVARRAQSNFSPPEARADELRRAGVAVSLADDWTMFVAAIADSIRPELPAGCLVAAEETTLHFACADHVGKSELSILLVAPPGDEVERAVRAARHAVVEVQQFVNRFDDQLWPGDQARPSPDAAAADGALHIWFGDESYPMLRLVPIPYRRSGSIPA